MKKRLRIISFAAVFCMLLTLSACAGRTDVEKADFCIYGLNADRTGLVKVPCARFPAIFPGKKQEKRRQQCWRN